MKKHILLISLLIFVFAASYAQGEDTSDTSGSFYLKAGIGAGAQFGVLTEKLYEELSSQDLYTKSWLTWETLPLTFCTIDFYTGYNFISKQAINLNTFFTFGIPAETGLMEDYDAMLYDGYITDYSQHENYTDSFFSAGFYADYTFIYGFGVGIGFEYEKYKFRGHNGYGQHNTINGVTLDYWNPDMPHTDEYEGYTVITYDITSFYWKLGLVLRHNFTQNLYMTLDAWIYLYRYNNALDKHWRFIPNIPNTYWTDKVETWNSGYEIHTTLQYSLSQNLILSLKLLGEYLPDAYGPDYSGAPPNCTLNDGYKGGFGAWAVSATISAILQL